MVCLAFLVPWVRGPWELKNEVLHSPIICFDFQTSLLLLVLVVLLPTLSFAAGQNPSALLPQVGPNWAERWAQLTLFSGKGEGQLKYMSKQLTSGEKCLLSGGIGSSPRFRDSAFVFMDAHSVASACLFIHVEKIIHAVIWSLLLSVTLDHKHFAVIFA